MTRRLALAATAMAAALGAAVAAPVDPERVIARQKRKRYYDPAATPMPAAVAPAAKPRIVKFSRQLVRSIRRELMEQSFARAQVQAQSLGFPIETPRGKVPLEESTWRKIWLAQLDQAIAKSKKEAEVPHA